MDQPFRVPLRTRIVNFFRLPFTIPFFEKFLVARLLASPSGWWKKLIPPIYLYASNQKRSVNRYDINYHLNLSKLIDHSIYFNIIQDDCWDNLFKILKPNFVVIDAGANMGYLTLHFAKICLSGKVIGFEPDSENFNCLSENVALNTFKNITIFQTALSDLPGTAQLYKLYPNNPGANRILSTKPDGLVASETIHVTTIDYFLEQNTFDHIDLLKIDVEGFELFVLKGASGLIKKCKPILFVELSETNLNQQNCTSSDLIGYIESFNYEVLDAKNMKAINKSSKDHHTDVICISKDEVDRSDQGLSR
jgi:FkbM family methyltransferase